MRDKSGPGYLRWAKRQAQGQTVYNAQLQARIDAQARAAEQAQRDS